MTDVILVGRSSSHFTRTARIAALELGVPHAFRPVLDMTSVDAADYGENPALKVPVLLDEQGALFGAENVCRALVARSDAPAPFVMRGDLSTRLVANAEELTLHVMTSEVALIMAKIAGDARLAPPKVAQSMQNALTWLDAHIDAVLAALPEKRVTSFVEVSLFSVVTHLPFREVMDVGRWARLGAFCLRFGRRESARATEYRYDAAPIAN